MWMNVEDIKRRILDDSTCVRFLGIVKTENIRVTVRGLGSLIRTEFVLPDEKLYGDG